MSNRHNAVSDVLREIEHLSRQDAEELYGIQFLEHGQVLDTVTNRTYNSLGEWAEESTYEDDFEQFDYPQEWED